MVGRETGGVTRPATAPAPGAELLALERASSPGAFEEVSLQLRGGEVLALYGKLGSGVGAVAEAAFGLRPLSAGQPDAPRRAAAAARPARRDRRRDRAAARRPPARGALRERSVAENLAAPSWGRLGRGGLIGGGVEARAYTRWHDALRIRSRDDPAQPIGTLSGGNQQKVLLGRWLERATELLVLIEPTRGVDVGARQDIYATVRGLTAEGRAVLVATSDYEEVVQFADRALVMSRGRVVEQLDGAAITTERLTDAAGV